MSEEETKAVPDQEREEEETQEVDEGDANDEPALPVKKHLLQRSWTMWYDNGHKGKSATQTNYHENIRQVVSFNTVEGFWSLFNNLMPPSNLKEKSNYHMFKEGVMPVWEDPTNKNGGKWSIELPPGEKNDLNTIWLHTLLAMVGEAFVDGDEICGIVISLRKHRNRVSLWTKTHTDKDAIQRIGHEFKKAIEMPKRKISFAAHADAYSAPASKLPMKPRFEL